MSKFSECIELCRNCQHDKSTHGHICWEESSNGMTCGCTNYQSEAE